MDFFLQAAKAGEPRAQYTVGTILALLEDPLGLTGVRKSDYGSVGFSWVMRAALKGVGPAYEALAEIYCKGIFVDRDTDLADVWYIIARQDDPFLRAIYRNRDTDPIICGPGRDFDPERAKHLHERSIARRKAFDLPPARDVMDAAPEWIFR
ncbi:hypothetical protein AAFN88_12855 [Pelagibius sp. CAU 1746]|uniref:hypothetical protein n=1 Tax=Pelagibius sp. CAU 1746 TaxID=3140370 RepID=UPI00325B08F8